MNVLFEHFLKIHTRPTERCRASLRVMKLVCKHGHQGVRRHLTRREAAAAPPSCSSPPRRRHRRTNLRSRLAVQVGPNAVSGPWAYLPPIGISYRKYTSMACVLLGPEKVSIWARIARRSTDRSLLGTWHTSGCLHTGPPCDMAKAKQSSKRTASKFGDTMAHMGPDILTLSWMSLQ